MKLFLLLSCSFIFNITLFSQESQESQKIENQTKQDEPLRIFITGSLSTQGMERIGKPINVISTEEIELKNESTIADTINKQPGISSTNFSPGASRPVIRGHSKERVRILQNGLESGDVSSLSDDHAISSDPLTTTRIDVIRGASTLMYGGQAIGGVVNIIDDSIAEEEIGEDLTGKLKFNIGDSATNKFSGSAVLKGQINDLNWHLSGFKRSTDDIKIPSYSESAIFRELEESNENAADDHHSLEDAGAKGVLENSDTDSYGIKAGVSKVWKDGFVGFSLKKFDSNYGIPSGTHIHQEAGEEHYEDDGDEHHQEDEEDHHEDEDEHHQEDEDIRIDLKQTRFESRGAFHLHQGFLDSVRYGLAYSDYEHTELEGQEIGTIYKRESFEGRLLFTHHHQKTLEGGFGFQLNTDHQDIIGNEAFIPSSKTITPAIFFVEDFLLKDNLIWQLGSRYENSYINPDVGSSKSFDLFSASTGLVLTDKKKKYSSALNLSYSERGPNATELFADGAHLASQIYESGDSDLKKESAVGLELVLKKLKGKTTGTFTSFIQEYNDYINLAPNDFELDNFQVFNYENVNSRFWGLEAELKHQLYNNNGHKLNLNLGFDLVRAKDTENDKDLPRITPVRTKLGVDYSYNLFSAFVETSFVESQNRTSDFELPTKGYQQLDAGFNYKLKEVNNSSINFFVKATNLTNEEVRVHNSFLKDQVPSRGRSLFTGFKIDF